MWLLCLGVAPISEPCVLDDPPEALIRHARGRRRVEEPRGESGRPLAGDHGAAVEVALLVFLLRKHRGGEKEDAHHRLAAERPLDQGVHDEDDRDDGEEDAVDVDV